MTTTGAVETRFERSGVSAGFPLRTLSVCGCQRALLECSAAALVSCRSNEARGTVLTVKKLTAPLTMGSSLSQLAELVVGLPVGVSAKAPV